MCIRTKRSFLPFFFFLLTNVVLRHLCESVSVLVYPGPDPRPETAPHRSIPVRIGNHIPPPGPFVYPTVKARPPPGKSIPLTPR